MEITLISDGTPGVNSTTGSSFNYKDGPNATNPIPGGAGGSLFLNLKTAGLDYVEVNGSALSGNVNTSMPFLDLKGIHVLARGGIGGQGGVGGDGRQGERGHRGRDATRYSSGSNGGPGGAGGNGGFGTSGGDGGNAGMIELNVIPYDAYLLMFVNGIYNSQHLLVAGGVGGKKGRHGHGGPGGPGGAGGSSYSWTTTHRDSNGNTSTRHHRNPGGHSGPQGPQGLTPSNPLYDGKNGKNGQFVIVVEDPATGLKSGFPGVFSMQVSQFNVKETYHPNGINEFGSIMSIEDVFAKNFGGMPSAFQRTMFSLNPTILVSPHPQQLFTGLNNLYLPGEEKAVAGQLLHRINFPDLNIGIDYNPISREEVLQVKGVQLGNETPELWGPTCPFQKVHAVDKMFTKKMEYRFPISNDFGIVTSRTLVFGRGMPISIPVSNISKVPLGGKGRSIFVDLYVAPGGDIQSSLCFSDCRGIHKAIFPNDTHTEGLKGAEMKMPLLNSGVTSFVNGNIFLEEYLPIYYGAVLQSNIYIQDLHNSEKLQVVQRRAIPLRVEPIFSPRDDSTVFLVLNENTTRNQYESWVYVLENLFGFVVDVYSITVYGHFYPDKPVQGKLLQDFFKNRIIIVMDDAISWTCHDKLVYVSELFSGAQFQKYQRDLIHNPRILFVQSSNCPTPKQFIMPPALQENVVVEYASYEKYLNIEQERYKAIRKDEASEFDLPDPLKSDKFPVYYLKKTMGVKREIKRNVEKFRKKLMKLAQKIHFNLMTEFPAIDHTVIVHHTNNYEEDKELGWYLGQVEVRGRYGLNSQNGVVFYAVVAEAGLISPKTLSAPVRFATDEPVLLNPITSKLQRSIPLTRETLASWDMYFPIAQTMSYSIRTERVKYLLSKATDITDEEQPINKTACLATCAAFSADIAREIYYCCETQECHAPWRKKKKFIQREMPSLHNFLNSSITDLNNTHEYDALLLVVCSLKALISFEPYNGMMSREKTIISLVDDLLDSYLKKVGQKKNKKKKPLIAMTKRALKLTCDCFEVKRKAMPKKERDNFKATPMRLFESDTLNIIFLKFPEVFADYMEGDGTELNKTKFEENFKKYFFVTHPNTIVQSSILADSNLAKNVSHDYISSNDTKIEHIKVFPRTNVDVRSEAQTLFTLKEWENFVCEEKQRESLAQKIYEHVNENAKLINAGNNLKGQYQGMGNDCNAEWKTPITINAQYKNATMNMKVEVECEPGHVEGYNVAAYEAEVETQHNYQLQMVQSQSLTTPQSEYNYETLSGNFPHQNFTEPVYSQDNSFVQVNSDRNSIMSESSGYSIQPPLQQDIYGGYPSPSPSGYSASSSGVPNAYDAPPLYEEATKGQHNK